MPFEPVTTLNSDPLIRVFFTGLLVIKPNAAHTTCEIFVHKIPRNHTSSIEIRVKRPNQPDVILARLLGPLEFAVPVPGSTVVDHGFIILTEQPAGIRGYDGPTTPPIESFRKAVDLSKLHPGKTAVHTPAARPSIHMNDGIFYSAETTHPDLEIELHRNGQFAQRATPFASLIAANIYNPSRVTWRQNGAPQQLLLGRLPAGFSYEIYVINEPLFETRTDPPTTPHDELEEYYKILPQVPPEERFKEVF